MVRAFYAFSVRIQCNDERWSLGFISVFQFRCDLCSVFFYRRVVHLFFFFALGLYSLQSNEMAFNFRCVCLYLFLCSSFPHKQNLSCAILMAFLAAHNIQPICMDAAYPTLIHCKRLKLHTNKRNIPIIANIVIVMRGVCMLIAQIKGTQIQCGIWNALKCSSQCMSIQFWF